MTERPSELLRDFPCIIELPVQWGDQDAIGHVNNVVPLRWFESARIAYLERLGFSDFASVAGLILAANHCNYRMQVTYPDTVSIGTRISKIGTTSLTFAVGVASHELGAIVVDGEAVCVAFNYVENRSIPVPDELRAAIAGLEQW